SDCDPVCHGRLGHGGSAAVADRLLAASRWHTRPRHHGQRAVHVAAGTTRIHRFVGNKISLLVLRGQRVASGCGVTGRSLPGWLLLQLTARGTLGGIVCAVTASAGRMRLFNTLTREVAGFGPV